MGNCALKPKVLSEARAPAPAPEELKVSLLEYQKIDAAKSLINLFLQDKEDEKTTPEKMSVTEDRKTALAESESPTKEQKSPTKEPKSPTKEPKSPATETKYPVTETKAPADDQKDMNEEAVVRGEKTIDDATVKERVTEAKPEEVVRREA